MRMVRYIELRVTRMYSRPEAEGHLLLKSSPSSIEYCQLRYLVLLSTITGGKDDVTGIDAGRETREEEYRRLIHRSLVLRLPIGIGRTDNEMR